MTERNGIARALEVLGNKIAEIEEERKRETDELKFKIREAELSLRFAKEAKEIKEKEARELGQQNRELTERLKRAEEDRDAACSYALQLEQMLEECRKVYNELKEGGADNCKKSQ